ncbi:hypothetical protein HanIR_Chr02g0062511 [Helianthus annuus]|nr:hypothetical protein HanIR_Chr02g0062511 [Helianthus annuus]
MCGIRDHTFKKLRYRIFKCITLKRLHRDCMVIGYYKQILKELCGERKWSFVRYIKCKA